MASGIGAELDGAAGVLTGACLLVRRGPGALPGRRSRRTAPTRCSRRAPARPACRSRRIGMTQRRRALKLPGERAISAGRACASAHEAWLPALHGGRAARLRRSHRWRWSARNRAADQGGHPGRQGDDPRSRRRRRPLCRDRRRRPLSRQDRACSSTRWSTTRSRAKWAASCMRWRCRPARRRTEIAALAIGGWAAQPA